MLKFIIPEYGMRKHTLEAIASIRVTIPSSHTHEIVVGNDGHAYDEGYNSKIEGVTIIDYKDNVNYSKNCNRIIKDVEWENDDILFLMNSDIVYTPDAIKFLAYYAAHHRAIVAPVQIVPDRIMLTHKQFQHQDTYLQRSLMHYHPTMLAGCCLVMQYSIWEELNGYDESFKLYWSDDDICIRAHIMHIENTVLPKAVIKHKWGETINASLPDFAQDAEADKAVFQKKYPDIVWAFNGEYIKYED